MRWEIDPVHTTVEFAAKYMMFQTVKGRFTDVQGVIETDETNPERSSVEVTIGTASLDTHDDRRDGHLRSADFLDVEHFPSITFRSRSASPLGEGRFLVTGDLTIRGATREAQLDVTQTGEGKHPSGNTRRGFEARTEINRKDFGLTWNMVLETGGVLVSDIIKINLDILATLNVKVDTPVS